MSFALTALLANSASLLSVAAAVWLAANDKDG